jgi:hypothetical protein
MAKATKITIHFDDGTSYDVDPTRSGSIFVNEGKAEKCGHRPPWEKPPKKDDTALATTEAGGGCYVLNGVIICP